MKNIVVKQSSVKDILFANNIDELIALYTNESKSSHIAIEPNINKEAYVALEDGGVLDCIVAYCDDTVVGFMFLITNYVLHYSRTSTIVESQFIVKEYRKYGTWKKMISIAEDIAKERDSAVIVCTSTIGSRFEKVANRSGFVATNIAYMKNI